MRLDGKNKVDKVRYVKIIIQVRDSEVAEENIKERKWERRRMRHPQWERERNSVFFCESLDLTNSFDKKYTNIISTEDQNYKLKFFQNNKRERDNRYNDLEGRHILFLLQK